MPTIHRALGLRFVVFTDDHEPAHVHVVRRGAEAKIDLGAGNGAPSLQRAFGFTRAELRRIMAEVTIHRGPMLAEWRRVHGREV